MRIHKHFQNRDDKRHISRLWHFWLYPDGDKDSIADLDVQVAVSRKPKPTFGFRFHLGSRFSETPLDAHAQVAGSGVYVSAGNKYLGKVAHFLTRGEGRDLDLSLHGRHIWWQLWTGRDHCSGPEHSHWVDGKYQPWRCRSGNIRAHPLEILWGPLLYSYEDLDKTRVTVQLPEGLYVLELKLQRVYRGYKDRNKKKKMHLTADWSCDTGIPWFFDHSGGWKGSRAYGSAVSLPDGIEGKEWWTVAAARIVAKAMESRVKTGWTPEHEESINR